MVSGLDVALLVDSLRPWDIIGFQVITIKRLFRLGTEVLQLSSFAQWRGLLECLVGISRRFSGILFVILERNSAFDIVGLQ